ncbi:MAG TPA: transporter [Bacteroidales bacterium]|jgi:hypothetical protein|nr:transporter [Bacteroidales bacterium]
MKYFFPLIFCSLLSGHSFGQDSIPEPGVLNFFLDCEQCDFNYVREELEFVSFVREPAMADVHILVSFSHTASGGHKYFMNFIGLKGLKDKNYEYEVTAPQSYTEDDIRKALLKMLKVGILEYYTKTSFIDNLNVQIEENGDRKAGDLVVDRWKNWVFRFSSGAEFQKEESQNEYSVESQASAEKITEKWKTQMMVGYEINRENYYDDGDKIVNKQDSKEISGSLVRSITGKWSAGLFAGYTSQTFLNIRNNVSAGTGIQYNFFPWNECNRRVFSIAYVAGVDGYDYIEETIYDKTSETHLAELVIMELEFIQPWGEVNIVAQGRNYFNDFSKNRLTLESDFSVRISKNLSVFANIESKLIHDQLYLPKQGASLEDILLRRRKLATNYEVAGHFGIRFTFGSIYNNVVNERFKLD